MFAPADYRWLVSLRLLTTSSASNFTEQEARMFLSYTGNSWSPVFRCAGSSLLVFFRNSRSISVGIVTLLDGGICRVTVIQAFKFVGHLLNYGRLYFRACIDSAVMGIGFCVPAVCEMVFFVLLGGSSGIKLFD